MVLTADQNIVYQQSLVERKIALVVFGSNSAQSYATMRRQSENEWTRRFLEVYTFIEMLLPPKKPVR